MFASMRLRFPRPLHQLALFAIQSFMAPFSVEANCEGLGYGLFVNAKLLCQHKGTDCKVESCVVIRSWKVNIDFSMGEQCQEEI